MKTKQVSGKIARSVALFSQHGFVLYNDQNGVLRFSAASLGANDPGIEVGQCEDVNRGIWTHVAVTYSILPRSVTLYKSGIKCGPSISIPWSSTFDYGAMYDGSMSTQQLPPSQWESSAVYFGTNVAAHTPADIPGYRGSVSHWNLWSSSLNEKQLYLIKEGYYLGQSRSVASIGSGVLTWINSTRGDGQFSEPLVLTTTETPTQPTPPERIEATTITGGALHLQIVQPLDVGGVDILGYNLYYTDRFGVILIKNKIEEILPFLTAPKHTIGGLTANTPYNLIASVYTGERAKSINILRLSVDAALGLEWKHAAVYLDTTGVDMIALQQYVQVGNQFVITEHSEPLLIGPYTIVKVVQGSTVDNSASPVSVNTDTGYFVIKYPPQITAPKSFASGTLVFSLQSLVTPKIWNFYTAKVPTPPGPPSPPWALLTSDESMTIRFENVLDTGGIDTSHYELVMRDALIKGMYVTVYQGKYQSEIRVGQAQFPGMTENRAFQLKARAFNSAGTGVFSPVGIVTTTDLCDLTYACTGGNAIVLDWSACIADMSGGSGGSGNIVYRLVELTYDSNLRNVEYSLPTTSAVALYEGSSLRFTRWDIVQSNSVRRYRVEIYIKGADGSLKDTDIYSSYLRIAPYGVAADLVDTLVHQGNLVCGKTKETIGSGTYKGNVQREWIFSPMTDGGIPIAHHGILLHFKLFDLECDNDMIQVSFEAPFSGSFWRDLLV